MGRLFEHKLRVKQQRRAPQDQRFRPFLKRQYWHVKYCVWPEFKALCKAMDDYFKPDFSLFGVVVMLVVLVLALYLFGQVPV